MNVLPNRVGTGKQALARNGANKNTQRLAPIVRITASTKLAPTDIVELGKSGVKVPCVGLGVWSWGDRSGYWGYEKEYGKNQSRDAYNAALKSGLTFIDTAEVYGFGKSEEFVGDFMQETGTKEPTDIQVATKFAPLPWRLSSSSVPLALKASLERMRLPRTSLYMQHWPGFFFNAFSNDAYIEGLAACKQQDLCDAIGVSNFNAERTRKAAARLGQSGIPLASNQVQYSLLYRAPETNGVMEACRESGTTLVAYSPLCQGLLTGKYAVGGPRPFGPRSALFSDQRRREVEPLISLLQAIGKERQKTPAQISINWCVCKGTLPIPGAKDAKQMEDIAGAIGWRLSDGEMAELDKFSSGIPASTGAPFEKW
uniref:NADP-dependent oxidoreductase domain-containing protein n=1 Tax=Dunaliella tertiolecta TaxID=3047 RepID=A0A7S3QKN1_DUNTE|mmetsp:Transcript_14316/g.38832  ORF Transcript_14316/g.38832 Transcript_14316/m.38832 type:complete len:370 (-) Transcript_14316:188-1297(-)|eukprot:CAMPEP_0202352658 /NCGR_PEP_ID=MMETSP1126-20121109/8757_1 /ASSEMBLY_ACC=CAM_ASM_000457 /TAXON_ID=3047 /ORGANISM="Dunaliella tertiolecta, Strain CCMP1320" /LENGTH=369 /DNA_ID=CAMNT_0048944903 /DNA_START=39 /DNA_END=1148 /DNA_ORIENTATION=-